MDLIAPDINYTAVRFPRGRSTKVINGIISALASKSGFLLPFVTTIVLALAGSSIGIFHWWKF
jgi:hypothetical protein